MEQKEITTMREIILSMGTKLNRNSSRQLRKALQKNLQSGELVCFDASELQHSDATGLAELFAMIAVILGRGGEAIVSGASANMRAIFELVQLDQVAEMRETWQHTPFMPIAASRPAARGSYLDEFQAQMA